MPERIQIYEKLFHEFGWCDCCENDFLDPGKTKKVFVLIAHQERCSLGNEDLYLCDTTIHCLNTKETTVCDIKKHDSVVHNHPYIT